MYCNNCGQQNTDDSIFCGGCGTRIASAGVSEVQNDPVPAAHHFAGDPIPANPVYGLTGQAQHEKRGTKRKRKKWPILAAAGLIIIVACLLILFFLLKERPSGEWIMPLLYQKDDIVYITAGKDSIALPDAHLVENERLNATIDSNRHYLYYLAEISGETHLMRLKLNDPKAKPELCAEGVKYANVSEDGNRVLLIKEVKEFAGDLIVWQNKKETKVAESVSVMGFGFSPNGKNICYYTIDPDEDSYRTLFVKTGGKEPVQIATDQNETTLKYAFVFDDGSVFYNMKESQKDGSIMYRYEKGNSNRIGAGTLTAAFSSSEWLIEDEDALYYYASGQRERISRDASNLIFTVPWYYYANLRQIPDKHFAFAENKDDSEFVLYECEPGKQQVEIIETDNDRFSVDRSFQWVEYSNQDDSLYLIQKNDKTWGDRIKVESDVQASTFDDNADYLYYNTYDGDFSRYDLSDGKTEELFEEVEYFRLIGERVFVITEDQELFLISSDRNQLVTEDALYVYETFQGGVHIVSEGDRFNIDYLSHNSATVESVVEAADELIAIQGFIVYQSKDIDNDGSEDGDVLPTESAAETEVEPTQTTEVPTTEPVQSIIPDSNLEDGILLTLDNEAIFLVGSVLTEADLQQLTILYLPHSSYPWDYHPDGSIILENAIVDLSGIEYATNLTELYIPSHAIERIDALSGLTKLELLNILYSNVDDIEAIRNLTQLKDLAIGPAVSDLSPLYELVLLEYLTLNGPKIQEIDGLADLQNLKTLALIDTQITDIHVVENFSNLEMVAIKNTNEIDLSVLQELNNLTHLFLDQATYDANLETISYLQESGCEVIIAYNE